jgi:hypothetical protein
MELTINQQVVDKTTTGVDPGESDAQMAANPNTNPQILRKIGTGSDQTLRQLVANNPNTPTDVLWQLGLDFPETILKNQVFQLLQLERLHLAAEIPSATLTSLLQCEQVPRNLMEYALSQQDYSLWLAVAYNSQTPSGLLENLAGKSRRQDRELIRAIAAHPHTPTSLLADIIDISSNVAQIVAENICTPITVLEKILYKYGRTNDLIFTTLVALHPDITPQLAIQMCLAPNEIAAQSLWIAKQVATDASELLKLAQTEWNVLLLAIVRHQNTPSQTIEQIWHKIQVDRVNCERTDRLIYDSFVGNVNTPHRLREELRRLLKW